jgi:hypothetical protein
LGFGDWGLGFGDWAQSPIPNPQSPIPNPQIIISLFFKTKKKIYRGKNWKINKIIINKWEAVE